MFGEKRQKPIAALSAWDLELLQDTVKEQQSVIAVANARIAAHVQFLLAKYNCVPGAHVDVSTGSIYAPPVSPADHGPGQQSR